MQSQFDGFVIEIGMYNENLAQFIYSICQDDEYMSEFTLVAACITQIHLQKTTRFAVGVHQWWNTVLTAYMKSDRDAMFNAIQEWHQFPPGFRRTLYGTIYPQ